MRTVGVEEELLVVNDAGLPVPWSPQALEIAARRGEGETVGEHDRAEQADDHGAAGTDDESEEGERRSAAHLMPELKAQQIELGTEVCTTLGEVAAQLRHWRSRADVAAASVGARVAALATSPVPVDPIATKGERFTALHETFALTAGEMLTCGCHVHVSVESPEEGVAALDRLRAWLPVVVAMSTNSPFWQGRDTGYAGYRTQVWARWPSAGPADLHRTPERYHALVESLIATGAVLDRGMVYFDARLSASYPTVEVRVADVAQDVRHSVMLAGLVRGLVDTAVADWRDGRPPPEVPTVVLQAATWRASRFGLSDQLVHPVTGELRPAPEVVRDLVDRVAPALADNGDRELVDTTLERLLADGTGADRQRAEHARRGRLEDVVAAAVEASQEPT